MIRFVVLFLLSSFLVFPTSAQAQSSWDQLIQDVQTPINKNVNKNQPTTAPRQGGSNAIQPLSRPSGSNSPRQAQQHTAQGDVSAKHVMDYKCHNPPLPDCLLDMRYSPHRVDLQNCRDITVAYLDLVDSYKRCVARRSDKHVDRIIESFNCHADGKDDCPFFYGDD